MFAPLMLPERLVVTLVVLPISLHVGEKIRLAEGLDDGGNVRICAGGIAVRIVSTVTAVRPGPGTSAMYFVLGRKLRLTKVHEGSS